MDAARLLAIAAVVLLVACTRSSYLYVTLAGENVEVVESGKPPLVHWRFGGPIPIRYAVEEPGLSLVLAVGDEPFVPSLEIVSSVPLREVTVEAAGSVIRRSDLAYKVFWNSSRGGNSVKIRIDLEGRATPVLLSGVIAESGTVYSSDGL